MSRHDDYLSAIEPTRREARRVAGILRTSGRSSARFEVFNKLPSHQGLETVGFVDGWLLPELTPAFDDDQGLLEFLVLTQDGRLVPIDQSLEYDARSDGGFTPQEYRDEVDPRIDEALALLLVASHDVLQSQARRMRATTARLEAPAPDSPSPFPEAPNNRTERPGGLAATIEENRRQGEALLRRGQEEGARNWNEMNKLVQEFITLAREKGIRPSGVFQKRWKFRSGNAFGYFLWIEPAGDWRFYEVSDGSPSTHTYVYGCSENGSGTATSDKAKVDDLRNILMNMLA